MVNEMVNFTILDFHSASPKTSFAVYLKDFQAERFKKLGLTATAANGDRYTSDLHAVSAKLSSCSQYV